MMISFGLLRLLHYKSFQIISAPIFSNLKAKAESQLWVSDAYVGQWKIGAYLFYWLLHFWNLTGVQNYSYHKVLIPKNDCGAKCFIRIIVFLSFWVISSYLLPWLTVGPVYIGPVLTSLFIYSGGWWVCKGNPENTNFPKSSIKFPLQIIIDPKNPLQS